LESFIARGLLFQSEKLGKREDSLAFSWFFKQGGKKMETNLLGQRVEVTWTCSGSVSQADYGTIRSVFLLDLKPWYTVELEGFGNENIGTLKDFPQDRVIVNCVLRKEYCRLPKELSPPDACQAKDGKGLETASCLSRNCDSCTHVLVGNGRCTARIS
jgi:hypothetical protein